ncbi:MAG: MBL fold metallo-hydrolase [Actinobacteria bacterium]|nr:MBL fold metallo-hydrolase [Actinomycetota bacterium]
MRVEADGDNEWSRTGVFEVVPGVYRIPLPLPNDGLRAVNVYAITHDGGAVLIDSGWAMAKAGAVLADALAALDRSLPDVERFLVTHVHRDHYTQAVHIRRELGTPVALGIGEKPAIEEAGRPDRLPLETQLAQLRRCGAHQLAAQVAESAGLQQDIDGGDFEAPDHWLEHGQLIAAGSRTLDVVATPGHTQGHVVFHDMAGGLLFAGDHVLPRITPSVGFEPVLAPNPLGDFLHSLAKVRARDDATLLPAHGPVVPSAHRRIDELLDHHAARLEHLERAALGGADTAYEAAQRLSWTRRATPLLDLDPFNQMLAVCETAVHLDLLVAQGRLDSTCTHDVRHYHRPSGVQAGPGPLSAGST